MDEKEPEKEAVKTAEALAALESPTEEEKEQPVEETETAEKPVETPEETQEAPEEKPDAKAFQSYRQENKALKGKVKELEDQLTTKSAEVGPLVPKIETPVPQGQVNQNQYFNPETGEFDADGYQNAVRADAMRAANEITNQRLEEEKQTNEAVALYPALNPSSKEFDKDLYESTSALLLQSMVKGDKLTVKEATEKALGLSKKALKEATEAGAKQELENIAAKEKATLEATASSGRASSDFSDIEVLSEKTRQGGAEGAEALGERLKRSGF